MPGLRETMTRILAAARTDKTQPVRVRLGHGLTIHVKISADDLVLLQLSRADVYPSLREWKTVLDMMPKNTVAEGPRELLAKNIYYLKGKVRLAKELLQ